ncbi:FAD binding domain-containing protein [Aminobacter aminovorans]|uniref:Carbon monoxide dehydrogenase n=1 Tax=Aminobacter aminovorans TaxID=83263 RepID=A0AAC8YVY6_AMIAI|nr:FAD binding domain-containing protein [Aminobacter aminovorans]AMS45477.1 carbon monoxide dehydrogenase [Aminobacter aminovorans]MBB3708684.1 carbon-monoxide dehydrogenase medium subunit [Aminobacter aminovorans]
MKPASFDLSNPSTIHEAMKLLAESDGDAKLLSGGQSLVPTLNLRLARPSRLVNTKQILRLREIAQSERGFWIGAGWRHSAFEDGIIPDFSKGFLQYVAGGIAYRAVRNRGTIGGSLAHADPAADWISALTAIGAICEVHGQQGVRQIRVEDFIVGPMVSALREDEILVGLEIPKLSPSARWAYTKFCRKIGEFAKSICAIVSDPDQGMSRVVIGATDGPPMLLPLTAQSIGSAGPEELLRLASGELQEHLGHVELDRYRQHQAMLHKALGHVTEAM